MQLETSVRRLARAGRQRQPDDELAAWADVTHGDLAGMSLDNATRETEPETRALAGPGRASGLTAERHVEHSGQVFRRNPAA